MIPSHCGSIKYEKIRNASKIAAYALVCLSITGCGMTMEDGYKPRTLGASPEIRKSWYASPFTEQAEAASQNSDNPVGNQMHPGGR